MNHSIFNDVLGPVMSGPSSSHSAGCARIGRMTRLLYGKEVTHAEVVFEKAGAYPDTYIGQGSNYGFTGGLLGFDTDNPRMKDAVEIAKAEGKQILFRQESLGLHHPNEARIDIFGDDGKVEMSVLTFSTGGGMFEIVRLNGFEVYIDGYRRQMFLCVSNEYVSKWNEFLAKETIKYQKEMTAKETLFIIKNYEEEEKTAVRDAVRQDAGKTVSWFTEAPVTMPVPLKEEDACVFTTAKEALQYNEKVKKEAWELAVDYECSVGRIEPKEVWDKTEHILEIMEQASEAPDPEETLAFGFLSYKGKEMENNSVNVKSVDTGILNQAAMAAVAVMENNCAHNRIVAAPTAGSSGVIPGAVVSVGKQMGLSKEQIMKGLLASGLTGVFIANQASFGAEVAACQAENGSSSAMAAAGVTQLLGGSVEQVFMAAGLALQNMLGLVCDPVGGLTEIPCINRNVIAMSNAVMSANMVMWGYDPVNPLDETICAMYKVGQMMPAELRCTCKGGLCATKTGEKIAHNLQEKRQRLR